MPQPPDEPYGSRPGRCRRVLIDPGGPILVEGPVEVTLPDGTSAVSDRFMVAICTCRRSRSHPWCDTSHRRRSTGPGPAPRSEPGTGDGAGTA